MITKRLVLEYIIVVMTEIFRPRRSRMFLLSLITTVALSGACSSEANEIPDSVSNPGATTTVDLPDYSVDVDIADPEVAADIEGMSEEEAHAYGMGLKLGCIFDQLLEETETGSIYDTRAGKPVQNWANEDPWDRKGPLQDGISRGRADAQNPDPQLCITVT